MKPEQKRKERISVLVCWGRKRGVTTVDDLLNKARKKFPFLTEKTLESYARAALRIILEKNQT